MHRGYARVPLAQNGTAYILFYDILWHINVIVCQKNGTVPCCVVIVYKLSRLMNCWFFITLSSMQIIAAPQRFNDTIQPTWSQQRLCSCHNRLMIIIIWWKMSFKPQSPQHTICCYCCCCCAYTFYTIKKRSSSHWFKGNCNFVKCTLKWKYIIKEETWQCWIITAHGDWNISLQT